jgi:hypothetical protein
MSTKNITVNKSYEELLLEVKIMRKLATKQGFFKYYFEQLKYQDKYKSNKEAFEAVNDLYFSLFGQYRYSSWQSFANQINKSL